jgi:hypothetical protein
VRRTTDRDTAVYNALLDRYLRDGAPPTLDYLAKRAGLAGRPSARLAVQRLARAGRVRFVRRMPVPVDVLRIGPRCPACQQSVRLSSAGWRCPSCG